jgi:hypothetical protein
MPGHSKRDRSPAELFSRIAAAHHGTEHLEGLAKTTSAIDEANIIMMPGGNGEKDADYPIEDELPSPSRLIIASPLYVAVEGS